MSEVTCKACGLTSHNLSSHFKDQTSDSGCPCSFGEYLSVYPGEPIVSDEFERKLAELRGEPINTGDVLDNLEKKLFSFDSKELFGVEFGTDNKVYGFSKRVNGYVPDINPNFIFDQKVTKLILVSMAYNKPALITGPTGCGKSEHVLQIAARLNYPVMRVNHHADMYSHDIVGKLDARNGETVFTRGPLPFAMEHAMIYLQDEWDALNPEISFVYQGVLDRKASGVLGDLVLTQDCGKVVHSNPLFRIIATANTGGMGDQNGLYQGTQTQNYAQVNRFLMKIEMFYPESHAEIDILKRAHTQLSAEEAEAFVDVADRARKLYVSGEVSVPFSTRNIINWAHLYLVFGDPLDALKCAYTNGLSATDAKSIYEMAQRVFGEKSSPKDVTWWTKDKVEVPF